MANKKYTVKNTNLLHNKEVYKIGSVIELDEEQGKKLTDILIPIEEDTDTSTKTTTKTPAAAKTKTTAKAKADAETTATADEVKDETATETQDETATETSGNVDSTKTNGGDK